MAPGNKEINYRYSLNLILQDFVLLDMEKYMDADLPPITTETLPTEIQRQINAQSWDKVSARQPIGCLENDPSAESLISYVSNILEGRLADVVIHRRELKSAYSRRLSMEDDAFSSSTKSVDKFIEELRSPQGLQFSPDLCNNCNNSSAQDTVLLTSACRYQLRAYVRRIASMYRNNRYHGLEHATHVTMSANKLLDMLNEGESGDGLNDSTKSDDTNNSNGCRANADWSLEDDLTKSSTRNHKKVESKHSFGDTKSWLNFVSMAADQKSGTFSGDLNGRNSGLKRSKLLRSFKQHVYSDMFSKFAFVFSAVIHDVDHQGVPNTRLVLEDDPIVKQHGNSSTAEKHSIRVAFRTLNESEFDVLRSVIFESSDDHFQLQRIVTNVVVSTDIASPERAQSTRMRWDEAFFHPPPCSSLPFGKLSMLVESELSEIATVQASKPLLVSTQDLYATLPRKQPRRHSANTQENKKKLIQSESEKLIQSESDRDSIYYDSNDQDTRTALQQSVLIETMLNVADVAHAMQSWDLFLFWNRRLYEELYVAYKIGRSEIDPSVDWFQNQLGFYKLYIIPLAKKMQTCGVFGRLGCVWTTNAIAIRDQWSREGDQITKDMIASVKTAFMNVMQTDVSQFHRGPGAA